MVAPQQPGGSRDLRAISGLESVLEDVRFKLRSEAVEVSFGRVKEGGLLSVSGLVKDVWMERAKGEANDQVATMRLVGDGKYMCYFVLDCLMI